MKLRGWTFVLGGLISAPALAFTLSGTDPNLRGWQTKELVFNVNYSNCPSQAVMDAAIDSAFALWNGVPTSNLKLVRGVSSSTTPAQAVAGTATDFPVIVCDSAFSTTEPSADPDQVVGYGINGNVNSVITYGALVLNAEAGGDAAFANMNATIQALIMAHEVGHVLGLGHSGDTKSLMYYDASAKASLSLSQDDVDGISYLYPRRELGGDKAFGCASLAVLGSNRSGGDSGRGGPGVPNGALEFAAILFAAWLTRQVMRRTSPSSSWAA